MLFKMIFFVYLGFPSASLCCSGVGYSPSASAQNHTRCDKLRNCNSLLGCSSQSAELLMLNVLLNALPDPDLLFSAILIQP